MLEYNYEINRKEGNDTRVFKPEFNTKLDDLVFLEGPNSSGKSTLLNIIALGLYGSRNINIDPTIKQRILSLIQSSHQKIKYQFTIENKINGLKLVCSKDSFDNNDLNVVEYINNKKNILTKDVFDKKYRLVYDIPDNPIGRLKELTKDLTEIQSTLANRLSSFQIYLKAILNEIHATKDPDKLMKHREEISKLLPQIDALKEVINESRENFTNLQKYRYLLAYQHLQEDIKDINSQLREIKEDAPAPSKIKVIIKKPTKFFHEANELFSEIDKGFIDIKPELKQLKSELDQDYYSLIYHNNLRELLMDNVNHDKLKDGITSFLSVVIDKQKSKKYVDNFENGKFVKELKNLLEKYLYCKFQVPGSGKYIVDFYESINKEYQAFEILVKEYENLENTKEILKEQKNRINLFITTYYPEYENQLKMIDNMPSEEQFDDKLEKKRNRLNQEKDEAKALLEKVKAYLINANYDIKDILIDVEIAKLLENSFVKVYKTYDIMSIDNTLKSLKIKYDEDCNSLKSKERDLHFNEDALERLEKMESHRYMNQYQEIQELQKTTLVINKAIQTEYNDFLNNLKINAIGDINKQSENIQKFYYYLQIYLAKKVHLIKHINDEYIVKRVDLLNDCFESDSGRIIKLSDMGTGQSQSAFLKGLLSFKDNRKLIVLFDEIAMMDKESLKPIITLLKQMYNQGNLLLAILVQKSEKRNIETIIN